MPRTPAPTPRSGDLFDGNVHPAHAGATFEPTLLSARARVAAVRPAAYARTRNALNGAVTGLSPYITHGLISLTEVLASVNARHPVDVQHKLVYELGWRAFFRHVWAHQGAGILQSLHEGPLPEQAYAHKLPDDIRQGATGVPVVDRAVRELYATGMLHNHARMWLASYVVHVRKVHWRAGADWLFAHLLDGDLASNHLSWQWVAGTGSSKPYLFNADNVARYAPPEWHSPGTVVDTDYETLDRMARTQASRGIDRLPNRFANLQPTEEPALLAEPPQALGATAPNAAAVEGREIWLVHPWSLGELPALPQGTVVIGLYPADFHRLWPWSTKRWDFVGTRMAELAGVCWHGDAATMVTALKGARRVRCIEEPHLTPWLPAWAECLPAPALFPHVERPCASFSQWWTRATRGLNSAADLPAVNKAPTW